MGEKPLFSAIYDLCLYIARYTPSDLDDWHFHIYPPVKLFTGKYNNNNNNRYVEKNCTVHNTN